MKANTTKKLNHNFFLLRRQPHWNALSFSLFFFSAPALSFSLSTLRSLSLFSLFPPLFLSVPLSLSLFQSLSSSVKGRRRAHPKKFRQMAPPEGPAFISIKFGGKDHL
jgi:hypothetical protein